MDEIKSFIIGVCISLLLIGFFLKLLPKGKLSKGMRHILSLVILLIILAPLSRGFNIDWEAFGVDSDFSSDYRIEDYKNRVVENVITILKKDVEEHLSENNFGYYSVTIETEDKEEGIDVTGIVVNIKSGYDPTKIEKSVADEFSLPCKAIIGAE